MPARRSLDRYAVAAPIYDAATALWSGGAIWRTRARALEHVAPGTRVLVPGAGTGRLAVEAARRGGHVVALEPSPAMRRRAQRRMRRVLAGEPTGRSQAAKGSLTILDRRLDELAREQRYDLVVAEHFLNVFARANMVSVRKRLIELVRPRGALVVADFTPLDPGAPGLMRWAQSAHHWIPLGGCALLTANALHPIYDHGSELEEHRELCLEACVDEPSFRIGPRWFRTWTFRKLAEPR
ncbi:MAG: methyltransferase domain-containing protein [Planctomycetota bacterium]